MNKLKQFWSNMRGSFWFVPPLVELALTPLPLLIC
jgi:hypothetical protein